MSKHSSIYQKLDTVLNIIWKNIMIINNCYEHCIYSWQKM